MLAMEKWGEVPLLKLPVLRTPHHGTSAQSKGLSLNHVSGSYISVSFSLLPPPPPSSFKAQIYFASVSSILWLSKFSLQGPPLLHHSLFYFLLKYTAPSFLVFTLFSPAYLILKFMHTKVKNSYD